MTSEPVSPFDWERMFIHDFPWTYLGEVAFRTVVMFAVILAALTVSGKREVRQLSIYELVLLIGLGSAAGDPMFYHDVPLASSIVVFIVMMSCYRLATYISDRNTAVRKVIEGKPVYVIENGCILTQNFSQEDLGLDELFSDLRVEGIEHLGQIRIAILEPNGQLSVFNYKENEIIAGLPILPKALESYTEHIAEPGTYACCVCGHVQRFRSVTSNACCERCSHSKWVEAVR